MALLLEARTSLLSFLFGGSIIIIPLLGLVNEGMEFTVFHWFKYWLAIYAAVINAVLLFRYRGNMYQVAVRGGNLGIVFGLGLMVSFSDTTWTHFGWYITALSFFHWSEYFVTAATNPKNISLDSYLLDHSREYHIAAACSWLEFTIEWFLFPGLKQLTVVSLMGLFLVIGGELLRKTAMYTAKSNFNHYVQHVKEEGHELVTHGVYSVSRHPSYVGWFYWSVGTQVVLCNPLCVLGYTYASWQFFRNRIEDEEITLLNFFGEDYIEYQKRVGTGLPGIHGYRIEL